jgi:hypothetical protein
VHIRETTRDCRIVRAAHGSRLMVGKAQRLFVLDAVRLHLSTVTEFMHLGKYGRALSVRETVVFTRTSSLRAGSHDGPSVDCAERAQRYISAFEGSAANQEVAQGQQDKTSSSAPATQSTSMWLRSPTTHNPKERG